MDFSMDKAKELLNGGLAQADEFLSDGSKFDALLKAVEEKLQNVPLAGDLLANFPTMVGMVKGYITKQYTEVSPKAVALIVSAFIYLVKGRDLINDKIPVVGYADDIAVFTLALKLAEPELNAFRAWRDGKAAPVQEASAAAEDEPDFDDAE